MFVPLTHIGLKGWIFKMVCPGYAMSVTLDRLLMLKNATVNRNLGFDDICVEKQVFAAYNNVYLIFEVSNITGKMVEYPLNPVVTMYNVANEWETQAAA